jgi:excisionase family DNA binding protein
MTKASRKSSHKADGTRDEKRGGGHLEAAHLPTIMAQVLRQEPETASEAPTPRPDTLRTLRIQTSRAAPPVPPGSPSWHGFAVLRLPLRRAGRGLTFGRLEGLGMKPMQSPPALDIGGMERKPDPSFFTERTLADRLAVSDRTVRNWIRRGDLPSYKFGAARRIDPADVKKFLDRHRDEPA